MKTTTKIPSLTSLITKDKFDWINSYIKDDLFKVPQEISTDYKVYDTETDISSEDVIKRDIDMKTSQQVGEKMKTIELFSGTKSFSQVMQLYGHETFTVDNDPNLVPDLCYDLRHIYNLPYYADILWASPPCQGFSVAAIGRNWNHDNTPKTDSARLAIEIVENLLKTIKRGNQKWWFIENPRGKLRNMPFMQGFIRHTVSYCQYGDSRMKPTDIWTNAAWWKPRPMCKNGDKCHEAAPRGARTGTQGIDGARDRGRIPPAIFEEILSQMP